MRVEQPRRRVRLVRALIALGLVAAPVVIGATPAGAQTATLGLSKSVSLPAPAQAAPAQPFVYFLNYACSSLTENCTGAKIVDVLPPQLSHAATDVEFKGNFKTVTYNPATGTATFTLFDPLPAGTTAQVGISAQFPPGTPPGTVATNRGTIERVQRDVGDLEPRDGHREGGVAMDREQEPGSRPDRAGRHARHLPRGVHARRRRDAEPEQRQSRRHAAGRCGVRVGHERRAVHGAEQGDVEHRQSRAAGQQRRHRDPRRHRALSLADVQARPNGDQRRRRLRPTGGRTHARSCSAMPPGLPS